MTILLCSLYIPNDATEMQAVRDRAVQVYTSRGSVPHFIRLGVKKVPGTSRYEGWFWASGSLLMCKMTLISISEHIIYLWSLFTSVSGDPISGHRAVGEPNDHNENELFLDTQTDPFAFHDGLEAHNIHYICEQGDRRLWFHTYICPSTEGGTPVASGPLVPDPFRRYPPVMSLVLSKVLFGVLLGEPGGAPQPGQVYPLLSGQGNPLDRRVNNATLRPIHSCGHARELSCYRPRT